MANNKALRGLGVGLASIGETLLGNALMQQREAALMRLRAEYEAPERAAEAQYRKDQLQLSRDQMTAQERQHKETIKAQRDIANIKDDKGMEVLEVLRETVKDAEGNESSKPVGALVRVKGKVVRVGMDEFASLADIEAAKGGGDKAKSFVPEYLQPGVAPPSPNAVSGQPQSSGTVPKPEDADSVFLRGAPMAAGPSRINPPTFEGLLTSGARHPGTTMRTR